MICGEICRIVLTVLNGAILMIALVMIGLGAALIVDPEGLILISDVFDLDLHTLAQLTGGTFNTIIEACAYFMVGLGIVIGIISFMGCCGACCESSILLILYSVFISVIIALEIALIAFAVVYPSTLSDKGAEIINEALEKGFKSDLILDEDTGSIKNDTLAPADTAFMIAQIKLQCCGGYGIEDYSSGFEWKKCGPRCAHGPGPISCCKVKANRTSKLLPSSIYDFENIDGCMSTDGSEFRNEMGCAEAIIELAMNVFVKSRIMAIVVCALVLAIEIALIAMSCCIIYM